MKRTARKQNLKINLFDLEKERISQQVMANSQAGVGGPFTVCGCEHYMGEDETTMQFVR